MTGKPKHDWRDWLADRLGLKPDDREALMRMLRRLGGGFISKNEMSMIEGVLKMREWRIRDVMIPLSDVISVKSTDNYQQIVSLVREWQHSRYPVVGEDGETVLGIFLAKDLLGYTDKPDTFSTSAVLRKTAFEPDSKLLDILLEDFRTSRTHMVIVNDEHGHVVGIVTIEDVLERIVGDIEDESDQVEDRDTVPMADGAVSIKGILSVDEFNEKFGADLPTSADSMAGWLASHLERMPQQGDTCEAHGFRFTVDKADARRVHRMIVLRVDGGGGSA